MTTETEYANTDLDLKSKFTFETLYYELNQSCCVLHYDKSSNGDWHAIVESNNTKGNSNRTAEIDILSIIDALGMLSEKAKNELGLCYFRDFNIGIHCWDTWAYNHHLSPLATAAVANKGFSISITLYPMRNRDGSPR